MNFRALPVPSASAALPDQVIDSTMPMTAKRTARARKESIIFSLSAETIPRTRSRQRYQLLYYRPGSLLSLPVRSPKEQEDGTNNRSEQAGGDPGPRKRFQF